MLDITCSMEFDIWNENATKDIVCYSKHAKGIKF